MSERAGATNLCSYCGGFYQAGVLQHLDGCELARYRSINGKCDDLIEECVPPDVMQPIRDYADSLLRRGGAV